MGFLGLFGRDARDDFTARVVGRRGRAKGAPPRKWDTILLATVESLLKHLRTSNRLPD